MKRIVIGLVILGALIGAYIAGTHKPINCHKVDLMDDYTFQCDGRLIQGHPRLPNVVKSEWTWIN